MELRVLQYFLAVAREQSISRAAQSLHLSQPTLSTQIKALEEELGKKLLDRGVSGSRKVTLTDEGIILRKRAEEILSLVRRTEDEITLSDQFVAGDVYIGAGETDGVRLLTRRRTADAGALPGRTLSHLQRRRSGRHRRPGQGADRLRAFTADGGHIQV